jgi:hypothetical protein
MNDNKFWLSLWLTIIICFVVTLTSLVYLNYWNEQKMAELGYQETMIQGSSMPHWQKAPAVK